MDFMLLNTQGTFVTYDDDESKIWEPIHPIETCTRNDDLVSDSSLSETSVHFENWDLDLNDMDLESEPGITSDESEEDIFMQFVENQDLLSSHLDQGCDLSPSSSKIQGYNAIPVTPTSGHKKIKYIDLNQSFQRMTDARFEAGARTLRESMLRSRNSRRDLCAHLRGLKNYQRTGNFVTVLYSVEFSTHHVNTFCMRAMANASGCSPSG
eukprot:jgi/Psemu1/285229/fgenesh1_pg.78_\